MKNNYFIQYEIHNLQPLRISNDGSSQEGQTETIKYIQGGSIRGVVVHSFVDQNQLDEKLKQILLSESTIFTNAYPIVDNEVLLPAPRGFYQEKKHPVKLENSFKKMEFPKGYKRADLGDFIKISGQTIQGYRVPTGERLNIEVHQKQTEKKIFRVQYIKANLKFRGSIMVDQKGVADQIIERLSGKTIYIGGNKSTGFGMCKMIKMELSDQSPYELYRAKTFERATVRMMLLSNLAMRDHKNGEVVGLDCEQLGVLLGVEALEIEKSAASMVLHHGFNRTWGCRTPSIPMYAPGSIFQFHFEGQISLESILTIYKYGLGIRRNEGCGQVLFLDQEVFDAITEKQAIQLIDPMKAKSNEPTPISPDDQVVLTITAKRHLDNKIERSKERYLSDAANVKKITGGLSNRNIGMIADSIASIKYQFDPEIDSLNGYFEYLLAKGRLSDEGEESIRRMKSVLVSPLEELFPDIGRSVMSIPIDQLFEQNKKGQNPEVIRHGLDLLERCLKLHNRKGKGDNNDESL